MKMKIANIETAIVELPLEKPLRTSIHHIDSVMCVLVTLETTDGVVGEGYSFAFDKSGLVATVEMIKGLGEFVLGRDPLAPEALFDDMVKRLNFFGYAGISAHAMTTIDIACWDILGKVQGRPLHQVFGGERSRVPAYASGGLWLSASLDELQAEAKEFLVQGFKAMKMRLGSAKISEDIERLAAVRDTIGPDIALMADANQGLTVDRAIELGHALAPFGLTWFEEPVPTYDHDGHAKIAAVLETPLATGETEYLHYGLQNMIAKKAANILMPDLQRMGGYTDFRRAIELMAAAGIPFSPHIFTEHSLHLCSAAGAIYAEHMPWFEPLFKEKMVVEDDGMIAMPQDPGVGFTFDWDRLDSMRIT
jgi:L-alanine-DL-glutamate epimerase-like enolase superfamily enzyme